MPFWRNAKTRPDVRACVIPSTAVSRAGENIESGLEPIVKAMRDLDRLVPRMIRRQGAVTRLSGALRGKVVMQLDHGDAARNSFGTVNLDLVIVLSKG